MRGERVRGGGFAMMCTSLCVESREGGKEGREEKGRWML